MRLHPAHRVPAGADAPQRAGLPVDQTSVEVADLDPEPFLPEVMPGGIRRLEACQVQNALIHGGKGDMGRPCARVWHADRDIERPARHGLRNRVDTDIELPCARGDGGMGEPQRAGGIAPLGLIERA